MKAGGVEIYLNHPFLILGSSDDFDLSLLDGERPVRASDSHVVVMVRAQIALVRVEFWSDVRPRAGTVLFDGPLRLSDGRFQVTDVDGLAHYRRRFGPPGSHPVLVAVDDPGEASRVYVLQRVPPGDDTDDVPESEVGSVGPARDPRRNRSEGLEYYLSEHDSPVRRLARAIELIAADGHRDESAVRYDITKVTQWLRWLGPLVRLDSCVEAGRDIERFIASGADKSSADKSSADKSSAGTDRPATETFAEGVIGRLTGSTG